MAMTAAEASAISQQLGKVQGTLEAVKDQVGRMDKKVSEVCRVKTDVAVLQHQASTQRWINRSVVGTIFLAGVGLAVNFFSGWLQKGD